MAQQKNAVRERPLLMSGPMVRAILDGRKRQTRRVMKPQPRPIPRAGEPTAGVYSSGWFEGEAAPEYVLAKSPYGQQGDRLWVRETFALVSEMEVDHASISPRIVTWHPESNNEDGFAGAVHAADYPAHTAPPERWKPSIHMPRWASRLSLEITEVRVERLQEISEADSKAEGISEDFPEQECNSARPFAEGYRWLWDSLNASRGFGWDANPFVWCISFKPVESRPSLKEGSE